jgi:hypothetical protein
MDFFLISNFYHLNEQSNSKIPVRYVLVLDKKSYHEFSPSNLFFLLTKISRKFLRQTLCRPYVINFQIKTCLHQNFHQRKSMQGANTISLWFFSVTGFGRKTQRAYRRIRNKLIVNGTCYSLFFFFLHKTKI